MHSMLQDFGNVQGLTRAVLAPENVEAPGLQLASEMCANTSCPCPNPESDTVYCAQEWHSHR